MDQVLHKFCGAIPTSEMFLFKNASFLLGGSVPKEHCKIRLGQNQLFTVAAAEPGGRHIFRTFELYQKAISSSISYYLPNTNKLASLEATLVRNSAHLLTYLLTHSLTGVKCRATSVAKNLIWWYQRRKHKNDPSKQHTPGQGKSSTNSRAV